MKKKEEEGKREKKKGREKEIPIRQMKEKRDWFGIKLVWRN